MLLNRKNGTGKSIGKVEFPTSTTTYTAKTKLPRGFVSQSDGLVKVKLAEMGDFVNIPVLAGAFNNFMVDTIYDDGAVAITDIMVYW